MNDLHKSFPDLFLGENSQPGVLVAFVATQLILYDLETTHNSDKGNYAEKGPVVSGPLGTGHC